MATRQEGRLTSDRGQSREAYANWSAPQEDGGVLVWPEPARLIEAARENRARLDAAAHVQIGGWSLPDLRRFMRPLVGEGDRLIFATGHQTELQHPGVWIKNAVCAVPQASGGAALHISVDTDAPKHLKLKWPGFCEPITDDPRTNSAAWVGTLQPPSSQHLERLLKAADEAQRADLVSELLLRFLEHCRAYVAAKPSGHNRPNLAEMLAHAQHTLDRELELRYARIRLSELLFTTPWAQFVCALARDARRFAEAYNAALADYRRTAGIDTLDRPAPNLLITRERVELPFWLDDLALGRRHRAEITFDGDRAMLAAPERGTSELFDFASPRGALGLVTWLRNNDLRLAPRALSLTLFVRLCYCDLFVHGIGGGLYDQVTDRIIRDYFAIEPPAFAVATATLFHPRAAGRARIDLPRLRHQEHKLAHEALGESKRQWLTRISAETDPRHRRAIFEAMHDARRAALLTDSAFRNIQRRLAEEQQQAANESEIFDRELFYAIQPKERLGEIVRKVQRAFAGGA